MSRQNFRPASGGLPYCPQRDLAYCYIPAMREALLALDQENWTDEIRELVERLDVSEEDISKAVASLTKAHLSFVTDFTVETAHEALTQAGWYTHKAAVRYFIYGRLGEVILGGFFLAIRDVAIVGETPPNTREIGDFIAEGLRIAGRLDNVALLLTKTEREMDEPFRAASLAVQLRLADQALDEARAIVDQKTREISSLKKTIELLKSEE